MDQMLFRHAREAENVFGNNAGRDHVDRMHGRTSIEATLLRKAKEAAHLLAVIAGEWGGVQPESTTHEETIWELAYAYGNSDGNPFLRTRWAFTEDEWKAAVVTQSRYDGEWFLVTVRRLSTDGRARLERQVRLLVQMHADADCDEDSHYFDCSTFTVEHYDEKGI